MRQRHVWVAVVLFCTVGMSAVGMSAVGAAPALATPAPAAAALPASSSAVAAARFAASLPGVGLNPAAAPAGVNVAGCHPSAAHPYPIVLVNGTFEVMQDSFDYLGPRLAQAGYCVFGYNYGATTPFAQVQALGPVVQSVQTLATEVQTVTAQTGAAKVDLIGYSQGGLLSEYYTKFGGSAYVHSVTALAPTTHGTTLLGIGTLGNDIPGALALLRAGGCPACADQVVGSAVVTKLDTGPIAVAGIPYTIIDTRYEDVVTPAGSSFINEPGVVNEYVQDVDPTNVDEHVILPFDTVAGNLVLAALVRAHS